MPSIECNSLKRVKRGTNKALTKISNFKQETENKLEHLSYLKGHLQNSHPLNKSYQKLKNLDNIEINRYPAIVNTMGFQNAIINQRYSETRQKNITYLSTLKSSPEKQSL